MFILSDMMYEEQMYIESQSGTARLDKFTHSLLVKMFISLICLSPWHVYLLDMFILSDMMYEEQMYIESQSGTARLDKFTHSLLVKSNVELLDALLVTLIRELQNEWLSGRQEEARMVTRRFLRSVARVYVVLNVEMQPNAPKKRM